MQCSICGARRILYISRQPMKTVIIILLSTLTCLAQKESQLYWVEAVLDRSSALELYQKMEITADYIQIDIDSGDRVAMWNNSGIVLFDHQFTEECVFQLPVNYRLYGQYHLGFKKPGKKGVWTALYIGKDGPELLDMDLQ